jgi:hypothetical protein
VQRQFAKNKKPMEMLNVTTANTWTLRATESGKFSFAPPFDESRVPKYIEMKDECQRIVYLQFDEQAS